MKDQEWIARLTAGACEHFNTLYGGDPTATERYLAAIAAFADLYGAGREIALVSAPGRTEVSGNHTDHNHGKILAAAVDRDTVMVCARSEGSTLRITSEGYGEIAVAIEDCKTPGRFPEGSSAALVAGLVGGLLRGGYAIGGVDAYLTTRVPEGSGLSSSAAFEVTVGAALSCLFCGGALSPVDIARLAQYAENVYFGKPCGLMDQLVSAVGGFVSVDFLDPTAPIVTPISSPLDAEGYCLAIVNTGGSHADLTDDYAAVSGEMRAVASYFGREVLRGVTEQELLANAPVLRRAVGDRALLRAFHFVRENERVTRAAEALAAGRIEEFLAAVRASGRSSFTYLQNVYTTKHPEEQGLSLALLLAEGALASHSAAWRVHGGGFAGTVQVFLRRTEAEGFSALMESVFGKGACMLLSVRREGATVLRP